MDLTMLYTRKEGEFSRSLSRVSKGIAGDRYTTWLNGQTPIRIRSSRPHFYCKIVNEKYIIKERGTTRL
jgi:hypothetical protein